MFALNPITPAQEAAQERLLDAPAQEARACCAKSGETLHADDPWECECDCHDCDCAACEARST